MLTLSPPFIIPLTEAPSQTVRVTLGGQNCQINVYTKSINEPIQPPGSILPAPVPMATFTGSIDGNTLTAVGVTGTIVLDGTVSGAGLLLPTYIARQGTGTGSAGTYIVTPAQSVSFRPMSLAVMPEPTYQNVNPVFVDLIVDDSLIIGGVVCRNEAMIVINPYLGFIGDLSMIDTIGNQDPYGTPRRLPPPDLRNFWQRNLPLSLGGKLSLANGNRIPGLGSRYQLTYWQNLK